MIESLTQEQQWGFAYAAQLLNDNNKLVNERDKTTLRTDWTADEIATVRLAQMGDGLYAELKAAKWGTVKQMVDSLTQEQLNALLVQFGIPDVLRA